MNNISLGAELFFLHLCLKADDFGRYLADPKLLRSNLFPLRDTRAAEIARWLTECESVGLIRCYSVSNRAYLEIPKFNQRLREMRSKFPNRHGRYEKNPNLPSQNTLSQNGQMTDKCPPNDRPNNEYRSPNKKPKPKRLIDAKKPPNEKPPHLNGNRSSINRSKEDVLMGRLRHALGEDEMARAGGHWRVDHVRAHPDLLDRALAEVERMIREGEQFSENAAACLEDLVKRWKVGA